MAKDKPPPDDVSVGDDDKAKAKADAAAAAKAKAAVDAQTKLDADAAAKAKADLSAFSKEVEGIESRLSEGFSGGLKSLDNLREDIKNLLDSLTKDQPANIDAALEKFKEKHTVKTANKELHEYLNIYASSLSGFFNKLRDFAKKD